MSPRWNWDSPTPLAASGAHSPAAKGVGESQFQRLEKRLAICLLCLWSYCSARLHKLEESIHRLGSINVYKYVI